LRGELSYNRFYAKLILGVVGAPETNVIVDESFRKFKKFGFFAGRNSYKLTNWQYVNTVPFEGNRDSETAGLEIISDDASVGTVAKFSAVFWGTANGLSDTNLSYIEFNSYTEGTDIVLAIENANNIDVKAEFITRRRGNVMIECLLLVVN